MGANSGPAGSNNLAGPLAWRRACRAPISSLPVFFALPDGARGNEPNVGTAAPRAMHPVGPAQLNHSFERYVWIGGSGGSLQLGSWVLFRAGPLELMAA